ncbi:MAG: nicotinate-nucleotide adenylyltransferase [Salinimicrobium sp.]
MKKSLIILFLFGIVSPVLAQVTNPEELKEVELVAVNYKYLDQVTKGEVAVPVKLLQEKVARFDLKNSEYYQDDYDFYEVTFYIPEGTILAAYNRDGKLLRTVERFKNVGMPSAVSQAIKAKYPGYAVASDVYLVNYRDNKGLERMNYKLKLENDSDKLRVKIDQNGNFL